MKVYLHVYLKMHGAIWFPPRVLRFHSVKDDSVSESDVHSPFLPGTYRVRINGEWARKVPFASKTAVMWQLRQWWVAH